MLCRVRRAKFNLIGQYPLTHFPWIVVPIRAEYIQESQQKIILQVYSFVSNPNYRTLTVISWGEFVAERLSSLSSSWRQGWSWEGDICNKTVDNSGHGRLSKRNWKSRPTIAQIPRLLCDIYGNMRRGQINMNSSYERSESKSSKIYTQSKLAFWPMLSYCISVQRECNDNNIP